MLAMRINSHRHILRLTGVGMTVKGGKIMGDFTGQAVRIEKNCGMAGVISGIRRVSPKKMGAGPQQKWGHPPTKWREAAGREMGRPRGSPVQ